MNTEELKKLEATLWQTADTLRANSDLKSSEYSTPVLGLIFLKFADNKYSRYEAEINAEFERLGTVTPPATLWFFDKDKTDNKILFIDARNIFRQIDRAHREFPDEQIQNIAVISSAS